MRRCIFLLLLFGISAFQARIITSPSGTPVTAATSSAVPVQAVALAAAPLAAASIQKVYPHYFHMDSKGGYKYGFDSGDGHAGEQIANGNNEVQGYYTYYDKGVPLMVKYKAGVRGYQAEITNGAGKEPYAVLTGTPLGGASKVGSTLLAAPSAGTVSHLGNSHSAFQFVNHALSSLKSQSVGLSYNTIAAARPATSAALITNVLPTASSAGIATPATHLRSGHNVATPSAYVAQHYYPPRPYSYAYLTHQSAHSESSDHEGNIIGKYSYTDDSGYHDLMYKAGNEIGFVVLGGSLSQPGAAAALAQLNHHPVQAQQQQQLLVPPVAYHQHGNSLANKSKW